MNEVVRLRKQQGVAVVALEEREHGNTFTQRFIRELRAAFGRIGHDNEVRVVVVHGYDNYLKCGFSPGMGATYILPKKRGEVLGTEMLLTARGYHGRELRERGAAVKVVSKPNVIEVAMEMAKVLASTGSGFVRSGGTLSSLLPGRCSCLVDAGVVSHTLTR